MIPLYIEGTCVTVSSTTVRPQVTAQRRGRPVAALVLVLCAQLMVILDMTIVNVALPSIESGLHFSATGLSWVLDAYALTFGGLLLLGGGAGRNPRRPRVLPTRGGGVPPGLPGGRPGPPPRWWPTPAGWWCWSGPSRSASAASSR